MNPNNKPKIPFLIAATLGFISGGLLVGGLPTPALGFAAVLVCYFAMEFYL